MASPSERLPGELHKDQEFLRKRFTFNCQFIPSGEKALGESPMAGMVTPHHRARVSLPYSPSVSVSNGTVTAFMMLTI